MAGVAVASGRIGERVDWRLAAPLGLTYLAFFAAPFAILLGISFYANSDQTRLGLDSWTKFYGDSFYLMVIFDTLKLGVFAVAAPTLPAYPLAVLVRGWWAAVQPVLFFLPPISLLPPHFLLTFSLTYIL